MTFKSWVDEKINESCRLWYLSHGNSPWHKTELTAFLGDDSGLGIYAYHYLYETEPDFYEMKLEYLSNCSNYPNEL